MFVVGVDKEHAIWHFGCRAADRHHCSTAGTRAVQHKPASASDSGIKMILFLIIKFNICLNVITNFITFSYYFVCLL